MANKRKGQKLQGSSKKPKKKAAAAGQPRDVPLPEEQQHSGEASEEEVPSEEDVEFVQQYGQRLGFLTNLNEKALNKSIRDKQKAAVAASQAAAAGQEDPAGGSSSDADMEEDEEDGVAAYERRPRGMEKEEKPTSRGLPVKTLTGQVVFEPSGRQPKASQMKLQVSGITVEDLLEVEEEEAQRAAAAAAAEAEERQRQQQLAKQQAAEAERKAAAAGLPPALAGLLALQDKARRREGLKQQMALASQQLLAEPEQHVGPGLRLLLRLAADEDGVVVRLALMSCLLVFKDLLPGYRIRPPSEAELQVKASREVQAVRDFEASLLKAYQAYLKAVVAAAGGDKPNRTSNIHLATARVAVKCMAQLLLARPGFNYFSDLLQALVPRMVHWDEEVAREACGAVQALLQIDAQGKCALEAVQLVADLVKRRHCVTSPAVVRVLLVLRFEQVRREDAAEQGKGGKKKGGKKGGKKKKGGVLGEVERDFAEAQAAPDAEEQAALQSQMLEALFEVFFRVVKQCSSSAASHQRQQQQQQQLQQSSAQQQQQQQAAGKAGGAKPLLSATTSSAAAGGGGGDAEPVLAPWSAAKVQRKFPLLQPVLEGLGRYSHLISIDYFNDLMSVLQELLSSGALPLRERLRLLLTASEILRGQGEALNIDRKAFYAQSYQALLLAPFQPLLQEEDLALPAAGGGADRQPGDRFNEDGDSCADVVTDQDVAAAVALQRSLFGDGASTSSSGTSSVRAGGGPQHHAASARQPAAAAAAAAAAASGGSLPTSVLLVKCLESQLLLVKQPDMARLAAFVKRLTTLLLLVPTAEAMGCAALLMRLVLRYSKLAALLEWEGGAPVGGRVFNPDCADPSEAGAFASSLWELPLLAHHYHPHVRAAAADLLGLTPGVKKAPAAGAGAAAAAAAGGGGKGAPARGGTGILTGAHVGPQEFTQGYVSTSGGGFRPPPQMPASAKRRQQQLSDKLLATVAARFTDPMWQAAAAGEEAAVAVGGGLGGGSSEGGQKGHGQRQQKQQKGQQRHKQQQQQQPGLDAVCTSWFVLQRAHLRNSNLRRQAALLAWQLQQMQARVGAL